MHPFIQICLGHNSYIYAWISKFFGTVVVHEEEKLKHFLGRLKVKVTLVQAVTPTFMHGFQNNFAQVKVTLEGQMIKS